LDINQIFIGHHSLGLISPRGTLSQIPGFNGRYSQYVRRAIDNIRRMEGLELPEMLEPDNGLGTWTPLQALAVLTYGPSSHLNVELIAEIERLSGQVLPREERQSRHEAAFYVKHLAPLFAAFEAAGFANRGNAAVRLRPIPGRFSRRYAVVRPGWALFRQADPAGSVLAGV